MTAGTDIEQRLRDAVEALPRGLRDHILRVEELSLRLAALHGVEAERASLAALGHDLVRHLPGDELLALAPRYGIAPDVFDRNDPILLHGPIAARMLRDEFGLSDEAIVNGVQWHTTAHPSFGPLEHVLFIADKIEPHKLAREPRLQPVQDASETDHNGAVLAYLDYYIERGLREGWLITPATFEARNRLLTLSSDLKTPQHRDAHT